MTKVLVAMSGGVDSSLAAALLLEQGYDVCGATIFRGIAVDQEIAATARRVCEQLGIPHHIVHYEEAYHAQVIEPFIKGYTEGLTPNPCLACNRHIKFRLLLEDSQKMGCDRLATGHYARIEEHWGENGGSRRSLLRARDLARDQSYVLYRLQQRELSRLLFPLGEMTKQEVRNAARARGIATADRPDSQDICFIPGKDYRHFLRERVPQAFTPGPILDQEGKHIGQHQGLPCYTVGQRKGLGISAPHPLFVIGIDPKRNALIVGPSQVAAWTRCMVDEVTFSEEIWPEHPFPCWVQVRAHARPVAATVIPYPAQQRVEIQFDHPQHAITPGQAAVLYHGPRVLGGGIIARSALE